MINYLESSVWMGTQLCDPICIGILQILSKEYNRFVSTENSMSKIEIYFVL